MAEETTLRVRRRFPAPRDRVFRAWTDPEALRRWWLPRPGVSVPQLELDVREGGRYRIAMKNEKGAVFHLSGTYREVRPPEKLVYTWRWERPDMDIGETVVTVEFRDLGTATEVVLTHDLFPSAAARDEHARGWSGVLEQLERTL
jgi:uncharacterized protein YndB with AHSA1/START domain